MQFKQTYSLPTLLRNCFVEHDCLKMASKEITSVQKLPPRLPKDRQRRLSNYYAYKSRSFTKLSDALKTEHGESALALGKKRTAPTCEAEIDTVEEESFERNASTIHQLRQLTIREESNSTAMLSKNVFTNRIHLLPHRRVRRRMQEPIQMSPSDTTQDGGLRNATCSAIS